MGLAAREVATPGSTSDVREDPARELEATLSDVVVRSAPGDLALVDDPVVDDPLADSSVLDSSAPDNRAGVTGVATARQAPERSGEQSLLLPRAREAAPDHALLDDRALPEHHILPEDHALPEDLDAGESFGLVPGTVVPLLTRTADPAGHWKDRALCAETDPEAFFPEKGGSTREAKRICMSCEVRLECLGYALAHDERFGIWGGLSERERRRLKKRVG